MLPPFLIARLGEGVLILPLWKNKEEMKRQGRYCIVLQRKNGQIREHGEIRFFYAPYTVDVFDCLIACPWQSKEIPVFFAFPAQELSSR